MKSATLARDQSRARIQTALVTGASSGLGEGIARALARRNVSLLLTALPDDRDRLRDLATELSAGYGVRVETASLDLAECGAPQTLQTIADELSFEPDLLVNNAGLGMAGRMVDLPLDRQLALVRVNIEALVALTGLYLPRMVARRHGAILNVASSSAFQPVPYMAVYAASKTFVVNFSQALWAENHRYGVRVVAACPGPISETNIAERAFLFQIPREEVVAGALDAIERDRPVVVQRVRGFGLVYGLLRPVMSILPRRWQLTLLERISRRLLGEP